MWWHRALLVLVHPALFVLVQAVPTPAPTPVPVPNPYLPQPAQTRGRPSGSTNQAGSAKTGPNSRTRERQAVFADTPSIATFFRGPRTASLPRASGGASPRASGGGGSSGESTSVNSSSSHAPQPSETPAITPRVPPQQSFIEDIKRNVDANIVHRGGKVERLSALGFPYNGGWAFPPLPSAQKGSGLPSVDPFYRKKVYVWVPEYIWDEIDHVPCPNCGGRGQANGWNPAQPRRAFLEDDVCYIIGFRYTCKDCNEANKTKRGTDPTRQTTSFNAWDVGVLARMDDYVSKEFPFILTKKSAISKGLVSRLADDLLEGKGFSATSKFLEQAYTTTYVKHFRSYVSLAQRRKSRREGLFRETADLDKFQTFGRKGDPLGFNSSHPSEHYLRDIWHKWFYEIPVLQDDGCALTREDYLQRRAQLLDGQLLAGDASFKYAKVIRLSTGPDGTRARPVYGVFTIMNEYDQVVFSKAMKTASVHDLKNDLKMMFVSRFIGHGFKLPVVFFTDECCEDWKLLLAMFREIEEDTGVRLYDSSEDDGVHSDGAILPKLSLPSERPGGYVWGSDAISLAVAELAEGCAHQGNVVGLDCEWEPSLGGATPNPVATVQLSLPDGVAFCFHLQRGQRRTSKTGFPKALQNLLEDPSITKVGVNVNMDASYLERDYAVEVANTVDLRTHARECWVETPSRSLAGMVSALVGKALPKDPTIRLSRWSSAALNKEQVQYACLDAYASILVYLEIEKLKDPISSTAPNTLLPGTKVRLYSNNHAICVGLGEVQDDTTAAEALRRWRSRAQLVGRQQQPTRVVVTVNEAFVPAAFTPHKGAPPTSAEEVRRVTMKDVCDGDGDRLALWDIAHLRLAADWKAPPEARVSPANANASSAYDDDDEFFATPAPDHVMGVPDFGDLDEDEADDDDGHDCGVDSSRGCNPGDDGDGDGGGGAAGGDSDTCTDDASTNKGGNRRMLQVRLDIFHALQRVSRLGKKSHGAFRLFMARLRDACFIVNRDDIEEVERALLSGGMKPEQVAEYREKNWTFFLRNCRRLVPDRVRLLKRFDCVIDQFKDVVDAKSGEVLLRPQAVAAVNLLRKHISRGCLSDPDDVPLYYTTGKSAAGITTRRCVRGTNSTEGYHRYLRRLLSSYCASPALAHSILLEFNYRWNIRMAVKNRGLRKEIGGFYDQFEIEIIQHETASWNPDSPLFSEWVSVLDAADTGERSGLCLSMWGPGGEDGNAAEEGLRGGDAPVDRSAEEMVHNAVPLPRLTHSAKQYALMMKTGMPEMPVHTGVERRKFASELAANLFRPGDPMGRLQQHQHVNFDAWAVEWNSYCGKIESGVVQWEAVYRKTSGQLQAYYEHSKQRANATVTLLPFRQQLAQMRTTLQEPAEGGEFAGSVGEVVPTPAPRVRCGTGIGGGEGGGVAGDAEGSLDSDTDMVDVGGGEEGGSVGCPGDGVTEPKQKKVRRPQMCIVCGHRKQGGAFQDKHPHPRITREEGQPQCLVPEEQRRPDEFRTRRSRVKGELHRFSPCDCAGCTQPALL